MTIAAAPPTVPTAPPASQNPVRTAVLASVLGTTIEWYDFFLYATAASLVFNHTFFPDQSSFVGTMLAFATFAVGFVVRPIGGFVFGHIGDRIGRKRTLALTMLLRGQSVHFLTLALLAGAYCVQFLIMAAVSDYVFGFWGSLIVGAVVTGTLTYFLFRGYTSRLLRILIFGLVVFFTIVYPLSGLLIDTSVRNAFDNLVQVGMIVYLFGLALLAQLERSKPTPQTQTA